MATFYFLRILVFILICALVLINGSKDVHLECNFVIDPANGYECVIQSATVEDDLTQNFIITGNHITNHTNADVNVFRVLNSEVPFVVTQAFFTFPNLQQYLAMSQSGLRRIQTNAVRNAPRLFNFLANINPNFTTVHSLGFSGGSFMSSVFLQNSGVTDVHENAFIGLTNVRSLGLSNNRIQTLPLNVFRFLPRLQTIFLSNNLLEVLDSRMFASNPRMHQLGFINNRIRAIDRNFLSRIPSVVFWFLQGNECIDFNILFGLQWDSEIQRNLAPCYENFDQLKSKEISKKRLET